MLNEVSIANLYFPPLFIYLGATFLAYRVIDRVTRHWLDSVWHPALARFFVSLIVLSALVVHY